MHQSDQSKYAGKTIIALCEGRIPLLIVSLLPPRSLRSAWGVTEPRGPVGLIRLRLDVVTFPLLDLWICLAYRSHVIK